jgi:FeS assembly SUF system regulator
MLRMGKLTDYGIVLMSYLAQNNQEHYNAHTLADAVHMPQPTVRKVLKALSQNGLLNSERGAHGGYSLSREPKSISIADIITAIEGPIALTECVSSDNQCDQEVYCDVQTNWARINSAVYHALDEVKLSDMLIPNANNSGVSPIHFYPTSHTRDSEIQQDGEIHG